MRVAAVVLLHDACEQFLLRLVRFGCVLNRDRALEFVAQKPVRIATLQDNGMDACVDQVIEEWWSKLERDTLLKKWDRLCDLVDFPSEMMFRDPWRFDRDQLSRFDDVRHSAVHGTAEAVMGFDFSEFASQVGRANTIWIMHIAMRGGFKMSPEVMFGLRASDPRADHSRGEPRPG